MNSFNIDFATVFAPINNDSLNVFIKILHLDNLTRNLLTSNFMARLFVNNSYFKIHNINE